MPRRKLRCSKCGQSFKMAMHLGRHMKAKHGKAPRAAKPRKAKKATMRAARKSRRVGRTPGVVGRLGLRDMSLEQLVQVISAAKEEARHRISEIQERILAAAPKRPGRPSGPKAVAAPKPKPKRKGPARRKFAMSGPNSILAFVKKGGTKGATTAKIVKNWRSQGRLGDCYTMLGQLTKAKKLKRRPLKEQQGCRYTLVRRA